MSVSFEFFEGTTTHNHEPKVTVRRGGQLILTPAAVEWLGDDVTHVRLGFSAETKAVGLRPAPEPGKGRYRLRSQKTGQSRLVDGKRFFRHHGVTFDKAQSFDAEQFDDGIVGFRLAGESGEESPQKGRKAGNSRRKS